MREWGSVIEAEKNYGISLKKYMSASILFVYMKNFEMGIFVLKKFSLRNSDSDEEAAEFIYEFIFGEDDVIYKYKRKSPQELNDEELIVNGNSIFRCDFKNDTYNFDNLLYVNAETARVDRYMQVLRTEDADDE